MLVEPDAAFARLESLLGASLNGAGCLAVVTGPVGAGKTELMRRLARRALETGALFLGAGAPRAEGAAPLETLLQVIAAADLSQTGTDSAVSRLKDSALRVALGEWDEETAGRTVAPVLQDLTAALLELSERTPLVIGIDDAHLADFASLSCLLYLVQKICTARILVVLNRSSSFQPTRSLLWAELRSQPCCHPIALGLLSVDSVRHVLDQYHDLPDDCDVVTCHQVTGGNARLLAAYIEDCQAIPLLPAATAGNTGFGQAILTCLTRSDPVLMRLVRAAAVLDYSAQPSLLSELLGIDSAVTRWAMAATAEAGLLAGSQFRHRLVRETMLGRMDPQERAELHKRAADVLYRWGGTAAIVAGHLVAAQDTDAPWSVPVLCEAARQALDEDDGLLALACLRLAGLHRADLARRAEVQTALALVKWRLSPLSAETDVAELLTAAQDGNLSGADALSVARYLSWYGRPVEAGDMLNFAGESLAEADDEAASALYFTRAHLAYTYPGRFSRAWPAQAGRLSGLTSRQKLRIRFAGMVGSLLTQGFTRSVVHDAQAMLQHARLDDSTYESVMTALETLMHADCLHMAALWCDTLYAQAEERKVPTWCAQLSAIGAMICLRQDRLAEAERRGRAALSGNPKDLGIYIGFPLAVLCLAAVRSGQLDAARSYLGVPVPEAMFETPYGLHYLRARGKYHEARGADDSAIEDFSTCGRLMAEWGIDLPGIVPWRTDLAGVRLSVGRPARELVLEQLARLGNYNKRTQGISLRLLASTADLAQRPSILERAVEILQGSGSQLELSATLEDLSRAEQALNQYSKARAASRRAMHAASRGAADAAELEAQSPGRAVPLPAAVLSDAEQRVAELAAQGQTNRQIAGMLYITVSTVEQHLTRVYRKLRVKRRADLAQVLVTLVADNGGQPGQRPFSRALMFRLRCASAVSS